MNNETTGTIMFLENAERFAESRGLGNKFRMHFESYREFSGVRRAAEKALARLNLFTVFMCQDEILETE